MFDRLEEEKPLLVRFIGDFEKSGFQGVSFNKL